LILYFSSLFLVERIFSHSQTNPDSMKLNAQNKGVFIEISSLMDLIRSGKDDGVETIRTYK
jgi:hypothetical protein